MRPNAVRSTVAVKTEEPAAEPCDTEEVAAEALQQSPPTSDDHARVAVDPAQRPPQHWWDRLLGALELACEIVAVIAVFALAGSTFVNAMLRYGFHSGL